MFLCYGKARGFLRTNYPQRRFLALLDIAKGRGYTLTKSGGLSFGGVATEDREDKI